MQDAAGIKRSAGSSDHPLGGQRRVSLSQQCAPGLQALASLTRLSSTLVTILAAANGVTRQATPSQKGQANARLPPTMAEEFSLPHIPLPEGKSECGEIRFYSLLKSLHMLIPYIKGDVTLKTKLSGKYPS